jgi:PAS domain S-box-containing protein
MQSEHDHKRVPSSWWQATCESIRHPIACVNRMHHFIWVNGAFERLVGYSQAELREKTWMDITATEDLGADLKNVDAVISGENYQYSMLKHYVHKSGHKVRITLTVWRHPADYRDFVCFIVEAMPDQASITDVRVIEQSLRATLKAVEQRVSHLEREENLMDQNRSSTNVNVGNNSTEIFRWIVVGLLALIGAVSYLSYVASWPNHKGDADPPTNPVPSLPSLSDLPSPEKP